MSTKSSSSCGMGLLWWVALIWFICFIFFDLQMSLRVERIPPNTDIIESIKDTVGKSITITPEAYVVEEDIINDSND